MTNINQESGPPPQGRDSAIPFGAYLLTACVGVIGCNSLALGPIAPEVAGDLGVSTPVVMAASSGFGIGTALSALFLARHIDRYGAARMLPFAMAILAVALLGSAVAANAAMLIAAQLLAGLAAGIALPAVYATAAAIAPAGRESATIGVVLTGWTLSMVAGVSLSAVLADYVGWRAVYWAVAGLAVVVLAATRLVKLHAGKLGEAAPSPLQALAIPGIRPLLVACLAFMTAFYGVYGYLGDHLHSALGQPVSANGVAALVYGVGFGMAALLDGAVDRLGARRVMPVAYVAVALVLAAMAAVAGSFVLVVLMVGLWGLANHFGLNVLVMRLSALDPVRRGTIMGLNSAVTYFAVFAGTTIFGPIYTNFGFAVCAVAGAALALISAFVSTR